MRKNISKTFIDFIDEENTKKKRHEDNRDERT